MDPPPPSEAAGETATTCYQAARTSFRQGRLEDAASLLERALRLDPAHAGARYMQSLVREKLREQGPGQPRGPGLPPGPAHAPPRGAGPAPDPDLLGYAEPASEFWESRAAAPFAILLQPAAFFRSQRGEEPLPQAFVYAIAIKVLMALVVGILYAPLLSAAVPPGLRSSAFGSAIYVLAILVGMAIVADFGAAALYHPFCRMLGGSSGYYVTYAALVYASTPGPVVVLLFAAGFHLGGGSMHVSEALLLLCLAAVWMTALVVVAYCQMHEMKMADALVAAVLPGIICVMLMVTLAYSGWLGSLAAEFGAGSPEQDASAPVRLPPAGFHPAAFPPGASPSGALPPEAFPPELPYWIRNGPDGRR